MLNVKTAQQYRKYADECRTLALDLSGEQRETVLAMVATWEKLAEERETVVASPEPRTFST